MKGLQYAFTLVHHGTVDDLRRFLAPHWKRDVKFLRDGSLSWNLAHVAASIGRADVLTLISQRAPFLLGQRDYQGLVPLETAAERGMTRAVECLLLHSKGKYKSRGPLIAAHLAAKSGHLSVLMCFPDTLLVQQDGEGKTPASVAIEHARTMAHRNVVKFLLQRVPHSFYIKDKCGMSALDMAAEHMPDVNGNLAYECMWYRELDAATLAFEVTREEEQGQLPLPTLVLHVILQQTQLLFECSTKVNNRK